MFGCAIEIPADQPRVRGTEALHAATGKVKTCPEE